MKRREFRTASRRRALSRAAQREMKAFIKGVSRG